MCFLSLNQNSNFFNFFLGNLKFFWNIKTPFIYLQRYIFICFHMTKHQNFPKHLHNFCIWKPFFFTQFYVTAQLNLPFWNYSYSRWSQNSTFNRIQHGRCLAKKNNKVKSSTFINWGFSNAISFKEVIKNEEAFANFVWCKLCAKLRKKKCCYTCQ